MNSLKPERENYFFTGNQTGTRCVGCKETFQKPILATISSSGSVQTYYACPNCLSKVTSMKSHKSEESKETLISEKDFKKAVKTKHEDTVECKHSLGYLKNRPKDTPIPDECLTCEKMIECLLR